MKILYPLGDFQIVYFKTQLLLFDWLDWLLVQSDNAIHGFKTKNGAAIHPLGVRQVLALF